MPAYVMKKVYKNESGEVTHTGIEFKGTASRTRSGCLNRMVILEQECAIRNRKLLPESELKRALIKVKNYDPEKSDMTEDYVKSILRMERKYKRNNILARLIRRDIKPVLDPNAEPLERNEFDSLAE